MAEGAGAEFDAFLLHLNRLPPEDRHFLSRLVIELGRRAPGDDASSTEQILRITREIAPERVRWVANRLGHG